MKFLKVMFLLILLAALAGVFFFRYASEETKNDALDYMSRNGMEKVVEMITGKKTDNKPRDELLTKSEDFYIWKDDKGIEHYAGSANDVPPEYKDQVKKINSEKMKGAVEIMSKEEYGNTIRKIENRPPPEQLKGAEHVILIYTYEGNAELAGTRDYFDKFNMPYTILDVVQNPEYAAQLKMKLGLDINKKYSNINMPVIEIDGEIIERVIESTDDKGNVKRTSLNTAKINKIFGLRSTFE